MECGPWGALVLMGMGFKKNCKMGGAPPCSPTMGNPDWKVYLNLFGCCWSQDWVAMVDFWIQFKYSAMWHRYHQTELFWSAGLFWSYSYKFYTSSLTIRLYLTPKSGKLYTIFLYLDNILATNPQWGKLQSSPISPSCWNFSTKFSQITPETWKSNFNPAPSPPSLEHSKLNLDKNVNN